MPARRAFSLFCLLLLASFAKAGEKPWIEVRSPHFRVLTDGSQGDARHVAREFEQMRSVFADRYPQFRLEGGAPLLVFAARDEQAAKSLEPAVWKSKGAKPAGIFHHAWEREYVMVRLDQWNEGAHEVVYHEYTHTIFGLNLHYIPVWLNEGLANFYGYSRFEGNKIYIGAPPSSRRMPRQPLIPVETLISVNQTSPYYHDEDKIFEFYAESWALVHFMMFGPGMDGGKRLNHFAALLQQGTEQKKAFQEAFGTFKEIDQALSSYLERFTFSAGLISSPAQIDDKTFNVRTLTLAETEAELSAFHLWTRDRAGARTLASQALKDDPKIGLAHEVMGFANFSDGKDADAASEFSQAVTADPALFLSRFAQTMLSPIANSNLPADEDALHQSLSQVLDQNQQFAPAYVQLAKLALRRNDPQTALGLSRRAEQLEPTRSGYHTMSGQILLRLGRGSEAAAFARFVADRWFGSDHDEAVELWNAIPAAQRGDGTLLPQNPFGEAKTIEGRVVSVHCPSNEQDWSFVLNHDGKNLTFHRKGGSVTGFTDTIWYGEDHFNVCHHLEGMRAIVHYRDPADSTYAGDLFYVEIRDDLPTPAKAETPTH